MRTVFLAALVAGVSSARLPTPTPAPKRTSGPGSSPSRVGLSSSALDGSAAAKYGRAELIDYQPVAAAGAVVVDSSGSARFTVLTDRLIRMESVTGGVTPAFEDRATLAILNRLLPVPAFSHQESGGVLTITTDKVRLSYTVGAAFSASTLSVVSTDAASAFTSWAYGQAFPGNLLGTIRGQDQQSATPLNCTLNQGVDDNGEFNHCEWGLVSRDGWVVYEDTVNMALDANDWWASNQTGQAPACKPQQPGTDAANPANSPTYPLGTTVASADACCAVCTADVGCHGGYVFSTEQGASPNCWPLASVGGQKPAVNRILSLGTNPSENTDVLDLYGFFHGHDYFGALADFVSVSGKTIMVPRYTAGVWNSRWFDYSSQDNLKLVEDYASRRIPLDVFVIDMDWHKKDDWSGFTFDSHLYPSSEDAMAYLKALGLGITVNIHDASGINSWEAKFPELVAALGLDPATTTKVPFNIINSTVA